MIPGGKEHAKKHPIDDVKSHKPVAGVVGGNIVVIDSTTLLPIKDSGISLSSILGGLIPQGLWDASANSPAIADGVGTLGHFYLVSVAGTQDLGSGAQTFKVNDWVLYDQLNEWKRVDNSDKIITEFRTIGAGNNKTEIGNFVATNHSILVSISGPDPEVSKTYVINAISNATGGAWVIVRPLHEEGALIELHVNIDATHMYLRLMPTLSYGSLDPTTIQIMNYTGSEFVPTSGTGTVLTPPTVYYGSITADSIENTPAGTIAATDVQAAINELDTEKATPADITTDIATHAGLPSVHHAKYLDSEAVLAMGAKADVNPLNHDRPIQATELIVGIAEIATQVEVDTGTDDTRIVTPLKLATRHYSKSEVDILVDATMKAPEAYNPVSGNYPTTYGGQAVEAGDSFRITVAGTVGSVIVNVEDLLITLVDTPGQVDANWMVAESNRDQATETVKGVAEIATQVETDAETDDTRFVTPLKLGAYPKTPTVIQDSEPAVDSTTSTTFQLARRFTKTFELAKYKIEYSFELMSTGTASVSCEARVMFGVTELALANWEMDRYNVCSGFVIVNTLAGSHDIDFEFRRNGSPLGTVLIRRKRLVITKVVE